jgi:hypothetical protein
LKISHRYLGSPGYKCTGCNDSCTTPIEINLSEYYDRNPEGPEMPVEIVNTVYSNEELLAQRVDKLEKNLEYAVQVIKRTESTYLTEDEIYFLIDNKCYFKEHPNEI